jgi:hypothetical protein
MTVATTAARASSEPGRAEPQLSPSQPTRRRFIGSADIVFLLLSLVILQTAKSKMLDDPGLGWHLRNIDAMLEKGGWLDHDTFSGPRYGQTWLSNQWLGDLPLWLGERWAGLEGIAVVTSLALAFMLCCLYRMLIQDGLPWPVAVFWTALAALGTSCSWLARPNLFTLFFLMLTARMCEQYHQGRCSRRFTLWIGPLFALWTNIHGGFAAGFTALGTTLLVETALAFFSATRWARAAARRRAVHMTLLLAVAGLGTLVNPYGIGIYSWLSQFLGEPYFRDLHIEWKCPSFHDAGAFRFELLMLLFPLLMAVSRRRPNLVELGLSVVWLHFALNGFRFVPMWVLIVVPLLARSGVAVPWLRKLADQFQMSAEKGSLFAAQPGPAPWMASVLVALVLFGWARWNEGHFARHNPLYIPAATLDHLLELHHQHPETAVFHAYDWGGYLTWRGYPEFRNWIDDRCEVQGKEHIEEYFSIVRADPGWDEKLQKAHVAFICIQPSLPLARFLDEHPVGWKRLPEVYPGASDYAVIYERVTDQATRQRE